MKKATTLLLTAMLAVSCLFATACGGGSADSGKGGSETPVTINQNSSQSASYMNSLSSDAPTSAFYESTINKRLISGDYALQFSSENGSVSVVKLSDGNITFSTDEPVRIYVRSGDLSSFEHMAYASGYSAVTKQSYGYLASCNVTTEGGAVYKVEDKYYLLNDAFGMDRYVKVIRSAEGELGFQSEYSVYSAAEQKTVSNYRRFIPSLLYCDEIGLNNDTRYITRAFSDTSIEEQFVRETFSTLPLIMAQNVNDGESLTVQHLKPDLDGVYGGGADGDVDINNRCGSIGLYYGSNFGMGYRFPVNITQTDDGAGHIYYGRLRLYSPASVNFTHSYSIALVPYSDPLYTNAMEYSYKKCFSLENPVVKSIDQDALYEQTMQIFYEKYREFGTGSLTVAGVPFSLSLGDAANGDGYALASGFIGQQVPIAYHFLRYGYEHDNTEIVRRGKTMMDFWTSSTVMNGTIPAIFWDAGDVTSGGTERDIGYYLRYLSDTAEGLLDAYNVAKANGYEYSSWYNAIVKYADMFVTLQMSDGSWYRLYNKNGTVRKNYAAYETRGDSKYNTAMPVRFLGKMYELTGLVKYKTAALKGAKYVYNNCYASGYKYYGGTPDNNCIIDKEAAFFATYCFTTAYQLETDSAMKASYLKAAEHSTVTAMSFTYAYDFKIHNSSEYGSESSINPFENGGVIGFSNIGCPVGAADNFSTSFYFEAYKMYLLTDGDSFYKNCALFLQNATKLSSDYNGREGYAYPAMSVEATQVRDFTFVSVNVWLPWSSVANIEPMIKMKIAFGVSDVNSVADGISAQQAALSEYGLGGETA